MERGMKILACVVGLVFGTAVLSLMASVMGESAGPGGIMTVAVFLALVFGAIGLCTLKYDPLEGLCMIGNGVTVILFSWLVTVPYIQRCADEELRMCDTVISFTDKNFDRLDADRNGVIDGKELKSAKEWTDVSADEHATIEHIRTHVSTIGHVTKSTLSPLFAEGAPNDNEYGISKADLKTYSERLKQSRKNWIRQ